MTTKLAISIDPFSGDLALELPNGTTVTIPVSERGANAIWAILHNQDHAPGTESTVGTHRVPTQHRVDKFIASAKGNPLAPITKLAPRGPGSRKLTSNISLEDLGL